MPTNSREKIAAGEGEITEGFIVIDGLVNNLLEYLYWKYGGEVGFHVTVNKTVSGKKKLGTQSIGEVMWLSAAGHRALHHRAASSQAMRASAFQRCQGSGTSSTAVRPGVWGWSDCSSRSTPCPTSNPRRTTLSRPESPLLTITALAFRCVLAFFSLGTLSSLMSS